MIGEMAGSVVRDRDGTAGKILRWQLPEVAIGWDDGQLLPREEKLDRSNPRLRNQIEVLTLDAGWQPLGNFMSEDGVPISGHSTITQLRKLISEADEMSPLHEKGKAHYPFKTKAHLGPGPRSGENDKTDNWDCKCSNYKCQCKGTGANKGRKRVVVIDKAYKRAYNAEYKSWISKKKKKKG